MARFGNRELKRTKIEIIPMIDTMFFLLVFFILASLNVIDVKGNQVNLPDSKNQDPQAAAQLTITIKQNGEVSVNKGESIPPGENIGPTLLRALGTSTAGGVVLNPEDAVVVINADRRATASMVRRCLDDARQMRFRKFSIATEPRTYAGQ
jgi:biopolymer transport protein ExbD